VLMPAEPRPLQDRRPSHRRSTYAVRFRTYQMTAQRDQQKLARMMRALPISTARPSILQERRVLLDVLHPDRFALRIERVEPPMMLSVPKRNNERRHLQLRDSEPFDPPKNTPQGGEREKRDHGHAVDAASRPMTTDELP